jgi:hypothetical protein
VERIKVAFCPERTPCPEVELTNQSVTIGDKLQDVCGEGGLDT